MRRFIIMLLGSSAVLSCKSYDLKPMETSEFYSKSASESTLKKFNADSEKYSLLIFKHEFIGERIVVKNEDTIFNDSNVKTHQTNGFAKAVRVNNDKDLKIYDKNELITVPKEILRSNKFVYLQKEVFLKNNVGGDSIRKGHKVKNKNKIYTITYGSFIIRFM